MATEMIVEFSDGKTLGFGGGGTGGEKIVKASSERFEGALGALGKLVEVLESSVGDLPKRPDKIEIEFRATLSDDCHLWIVTGDSDGEFKIKLSWERGRS